MAVLAVAAGGAAIGGTIGAGVGATMLGVSLGWAVGSMVGQRLFGPDLPSTEGPRLEHLAVQNSAYGEDIPFTYGNTRLAGNIIWTGPVVEHEHTEKVGGKGGPEGEHTTYSYTCSFAVGICQGPIMGIGRIWADGNLIRDNPTDADIDPTVAEEEAGQEFSNAYLTRVVLEDKFAARVEVYLGTDDQEPCDIIESEEEGDVPAYRGLAYIVFKDMSLDQFGRRRPNLEFEVINSDTLDRLFFLLPELPHHYHYTDISWTPWGLVAGWGHGASHHHGYTYWDLWSGFPGEKTRFLQQQNNYYHVGWGDYWEGQYHVHNRGGYLIYDLEEQELVFAEGRFPRFTGANCISGGEIWRPPTPNGFVYQAIDVRPTSLDPVSYWPCPEGYGVTPAGPAETADFPTEVGIEFWYGNVKFRTNLSEYQDIIAAHSDRRGWAVGTWFAAYVVGRFAGSSTYALFEFRNPGTNALYVGERGVPWHNFEIGGVISYRHNPEEPAKECLYGIAKIEEGFAGTEALVIFDGFEYTEDAKVIMAPHDIFYCGDNGRTTAYVTIIPPHGPTLVRCGRKVYICEGISLDPMYAQRTRGDGMPLDLVVADLLRRSGLEEGQFDVSGLAEIGGAYNAWYAEEIVITGELVAPGNGFVYRVLTTGETGEEEPTWPEELDTIVTKDGISYLCYAYDTPGVPGYVIPHNMSLRDALAPLQRLYNFDLIESEWKLKCIYRGRSVQKEIAESDLGAHEGTTTTDEHLSIKRAQEVGLPTRLRISYMNRDADYQNNTQQAFKIVSESVAEQEYILPVVITNTQALRAAERLLQVAWVQRISYQATIPSDYFALEPGDVVRIAGHRVLLTSLVFRFPLMLELEGVQDLDTAYISEAEADDTYLPEPEVPIIGGPTISQFLNLPMLGVSAPRGPGFFVTGYGMSEAWDRATLYKSTDGGLSWRSVLPIDNQATVGKLTDVLGAGVSPTRWDRKNSFNVKINTPGRTLESKSELNVLDGENVAAIGKDGRWEIVGFVDVYEEGDGSYTCSTLVRGMRGTERNMANHQEDDTFVFLDPTTMYWVSTERTGEVLHYKVITSGRALQDFPARHFTSAAETLKPWSPVHIRGDRDGDGNIMIRWLRRARYYNDWRDGSDVPVVEASETYDVRILDGDGEMVRQLFGFDNPQDGLEYSAADQIEDFGETQSSIDVRITQQSADRGPGHPAQATI